MRVQILLSAAVLAGVLPALALPLQYADATALYTRADALLDARSSLAEYTTDIERRSGRAPGTGGRSRRKAPEPLGPPHNTYEEATHAYHSTTHMPAVHDTFHTGTGCESFSSSVIIRHAPTSC